jgi:hypothetical protein
MTSDHDQLQERRLNRQLNHAARYAALHADTEAEATQVAGVIAAVDDGLIQRREALEALQNLRRQQQAA